MSENETGGAGKTEAALRITNVSKTFPGQKALDAVSISVRPGRVHALLGENGSGKSTLIKILAGVYIPDPGGDVQVNGSLLPFGSPTSSFSAGLRFVHQKLGLIPEMSAVENIALEAGYERGKFIDWKAQRRLARRLIDRLGVEVDLDRPLSDSKPIERSAVAIARALRTERRDAELSPLDVPVVVLDEPSASLPPAEVQLLFALLRDLTSRGIAVVYVSHRLDEIFDIADDVSVLRDGRLQGTEGMAGMTRDRLVSLIVGRDLTDHWDRPVATAGEFGDTVLEVDGLSAGILRDLSFSVRAGEIVGVVGVAGSGRESLSAVLSGAAVPESGSVTVCGNRMLAPTPRDLVRAGMVTAFGNTQPHSATHRFSVRENLTLASISRYARLGRMVRRPEAEDVRGWIASLDLRPPDPNVPYEQLSGGNQQKVILGKWLNSGPKMLIVDEPTAGVDVGARQSIYGLVTEQASKGLGVLVCSSDLEDVVSLCSRVLVIRNGRVVAEATENAVREDRLLLESVGTGNQQEESGL